MPTSAIRAWPCAWPHLKYPRNHMKLLLGQNRVGQNRVWTYLAVNANAVFRPLVDGYSKYQNILSRSHVPSVPLGHLRFYLSSSLVHDVVASRKMSQLSSHQAQEAARALRSASKSSRTRLGRRGPMRAHDQHDEKPHTCGSVHTLARCQQTDCANGHRMPR